jgi:hypothetical protein
MISVGWAKAAEALGIYHRLRSAVPTLHGFGGHASLCPPYELTGCSHDGTIG